MPLDSIVGAFVYGLVGSLHCAGMCGPLCCTLLGSGAGARGSAFRAALAYSGTRVLAYSFLGALFGLVGRAASVAVPEAVFRSAPVLFGVLLLLVAFRADRLLARFHLPTGPLTFLMNRLALLSGPSRGAALGLATPLLPCGFLYGALTGALLAGSVLKGMLVMLAFACGTVPILVLLVTGVGGLRGRVSNKTLGRIQQGLALVSAGMLFWWSFRYAASPGPESCCHH